MMQNKKLTREEFIKAIESLNFKFKEDYDFLYEVYEFVCDAIFQVIKNTDLPFTPINHYIVILYILNEYTYSLSSLIHLPLICGIYSSSINSSNG